MMNRLALAVLVAGATASLASAQTCPSTSSNTTFNGGTMQTDCNGTITTGCTSKSGTTYSTTTNTLNLPTTAGNFQSPPGAAVNSSVYYAAPADFDKDGWDDFVAADDGDQIYFMRNQTITCGTASCSGSAVTAPTVQVIAPAWWNTLTNVRPAAFRETTSTLGLNVPLKAAVNGGSPELKSPMVAADFDGDGWPDVAVISMDYNPTGNLLVWPTAARLFLNTQNCHDATNQMCGIGRLCTGQPSNGACSGSGVAGHGTPWLETQLSCTTTSVCPYYQPSFATYDLRTGSPVSSIGTTSSTSPTTSHPGDFGPIEHASTNMIAMDWDGDGDIDIIFAHSPGTCPGSLCTTSGQTFYVAVDVWKNDCAQSPQWNSATKSCIGHIPTFSHSTSGTCTGASCNNADVLIPSTAHNTTTVVPSVNFNWDSVGMSGIPHRGPSIAYVDIDKDGDYDLALASPGCCTPSANAKYQLQIFRGTTNNPTTHMLDTANPIQMGTSSGAYPGFEGAATGVFLYDFSGDGYPDMITASDGFAVSASIGGRTRYWQNTGAPNTPFGTNWPSCSATPATCAGCSATCNPSPTTKISESCGTNTCAQNLGAHPPTFPDFDIGLMLDYDHDPQNTKDIVITNGNSSNEFYIFPNRASPSSVAACGSVISGTLPVSGAEETVTGGCIAPTATVPANTSITYYMSNENPANWQLACTQTSAGFAPPLVGGQCCASFPNSTGKTIEWKAVFDSNTTDGVGNCTLTGPSSPTLTSVLANYTYNLATQHYDAGVIVSDGVVYTGSFDQPGNRGHMYAAAAALNQTYFDVGPKIDAQGTRYVYTTDNTGTSLSRINFSPGAPSPTLQARIGASSAGQATNVINWVLSPRFGVGGSSTTNLGAVIDSTPAILNIPFRPNWYVYLNTTDKALYDAFSTANLTRVPLLLFASMDGMLHAAITLPTTITDPHSGTEAWGFIPPYVASNMTNDYTTSCTPNCAGGTLSVTSYPDGSPSLLDYKKASGSIATAAILGDGAGGTSVTALDVTSTVTPGTYATTGPTPMWSQQPGGASAGSAMSKPGVARTSIAGTETYVVVTGTGINAADSSKGKVVVGYNLETGALLWQFEMQCPLTSDVTIFETDDAGEPGSPTIDGFADRAVFADECGYVYKINPGQNLAGGYMDNTGYGPISVGALHGVNRYALFSTQLTAGAIGGQRPIANTIGAITDATTDMVLFFGTGGLQNFNTTQSNEFYAVYAKNGTIRNKLTGSCTLSGGVTRCEKFYGGVVVTPDNVILERTVDPIVGGGSCDLGSTHIQSYSLNSFSSLTFDISQINSQPIAAVAGPLYGDAGALYFATVGGQIERIGQPRAATAGGDTAAGIGVGNGTPQDMGTNTPFTLMGWRVVL